MSITMAITRPISTLVAWGLATALLLGAVGCSTYPAAPAQPAYDTDVLPIFEAHCTRCHDNNPDGGGANHQVFLPDAAGGPMTAGQPHLTVFGPCYPGDGGAPLCIGVPSWRKQITTAIHATDSTRMPLAPARPLDDWELNVIDSWLAEPSPICSRSKNPDPALLCP